MRNLYCVFFLLVMSNIAVAKDQFRCEKTQGNSTYVISGCAPYNLLGPGSQECRYISIHKDGQLISQVDMWGGYGIGADDASMMAFSKPFGVENNQAEFWLEYNYSKQEAGFKIGRSRITLKHLNCSLETPSWYTERLSGKIFKSDVVYSQTLAEKLKLLTLYLDQAKSFGVEMDNSANSVLIHAVLSDTSKIEFEIVKINGYRKPFPDYENFKVLVSSLISGRAPQWGYRSIDLSREEFEMLLSLDYLQNLQTSRKSTGSSGITFESMYYEAQ